MKLYTLSLFTITLTLTTAHAHAHAHALPAKNGIGPIIIEPVDERTNRFVGPESSVDKCDSDSDCQFLSVCFHYLFKMGGVGRWLMICSVLGV